MLPDIQPGNTKILYFFNCLLDGMHTIGSLFGRPFCLNKSGLYFFFVFCFAAVVVVSAAASVVAEAALCSS